MPDGTAVSRPLWARKTSWAVAAITIALLLIVRYATAASFRTDIAATQNELAVATGKVQALQDEIGSTRAEADKHIKDEQEKRIAAEKKLELLQHVTSPTSAPSSAPSTAPQSAPPYVTAAAPTTMPSEMTPTIIAAHTPAKAGVHTFGDGTFIVGTDILPGTYRNSGVSGCYWERLSRFDGGTVIANDFTDNSAIVTIAATDKGFKSKDCGTWTDDLSQITESKVTFGDGTFIVGTDILPGTYRNSGVSGCYWERLSRFDGGTVIANDLTDDIAIVTIAATDKGFKSKGCGVWKRA